jgi:hypothetical protein
VKSGKIANTRVKHSKKAKCRDRLHKWVWLKPEMYKRGENNENYVI